MERVKLQITLLFEEPIRPWAELRGLLRAAEGRETVELQGQPFTTVRPEAKERIITRIRGVDISEERDGFEAAQARLDAMNAASPFPSAISVRLDVAIIEPADLPFQDLLARMKDHLLAPGHLAKRATDIQVVYDEQASDTQTEHIQLGPMLAAQLNGQILAFSRDDLPPQFLYLGIGRTLKGKIAYDSDELRNLYSGFENWAQGRAREISDLILGGQ